MNEGTTEADAQAYAADPGLAAGWVHDGIGFVGPDVPIEVLLATGRPFGHLPWATTDFGRADAWLESSFPFWARSILAQWDGGAFDGLEAVVFSRGDDACQRLYYYVCELQRRCRLAGPRPLIFDIAYIARESSEMHTADAIDLLCRALHVDPGLLPAAIDRANRLRKTLNGIERARGSDGPFYERLGRAALWSDPTAWIDHVKLPAADPGRMRVLLAGSTPPDDRLHIAIEAGGASVVADTGICALSRLGEAVTAVDGPAERQLARHLRSASVGPRAPFDRARWLVDRAKTARADAVVLWLTRQDEALAWHVPAQRQALAAAGIPALVLPASSWAADDDTLERLASFCAEVADATA